MSIIKNITNKIDFTHLIPLAVFILIVVIYFYPILEGKEIIQTDKIQFRGTNHESIEYMKNGEDILWTNSSFGGMPIFKSSDTNAYFLIHKFNRLIPEPIILLIWGFIGFYVFLTAFKINKWIAFIGSFAFCFSTFNFLSIEAGHSNKVYDAMLMAPVLAGVFLIYKGKIFKGAVLMLIFLGLEIFYGHIQIQYYLLYMLLGIAIMELVKAIRTKEIKPFIIRSLLILAIALISIGPNIVRLWSLAELAPSTIRGGSELEDNTSNGLDYEYAFQWSNGILEPFTIAFPYFYGGSSTEPLSQNSNTYKTLISRGVSRQQSNEFLNRIPLYWGKQPFTGGPIYFGAIVFLLFITGIFLIKSPVKWWAISFTLLSIILSWGSNFPLVTDFFYNYVPLYNKFRSVTMIMIVAQISMIFFAFYTLKELLNTEISLQKRKDALKKGFFVAAGIGVFFLLFGSTIFSFSAPVDTQLQADWLADAIKQDRRAKFFGDIIRTLVFILIATGSLWLYYIDKIKSQVVLYLIALLVVVDLWTVNKRYVNSDDFENLKRYERNVFMPTDVDKEINKDDDLYFRVFNLTRNAFSEGITSYHHKSIGGYSAIKLQRYQDIIDYHLSKNNMAVINMLNVKYFILPDNERNVPVARLNDASLGNAWFIKDIIIAKDPKDEIEKLKDFDPANQVILDEQFNQNIDNKTFSGAGEISLVSYHPEKLIYKSSSDQEQFAVFSDIFYQPGWKSYVDGQESEHFRVNYILRGMIIPPGDHKIEFSFKPPSYAIGGKISLAFSILVGLALLGIIIQSQRGKESFKEE